MSAKRKTRASGPTQPEGKRTNRGVKLRLPPEVVEEIKVQAKHLGIPVSELVTRAWRAYVA